MTTEREAVQIGAAALLHLAEHPDDFQRLLSLSGLDVDGVRARAQDPEFLGFVLEFLMGDEATAERFCVAEALTGERLAAARAALPGGDAPHWL